MDKCHKIITKIFALFDLSILKSHFVLISSVRSNRYNGYRFSWTILNLTLCVAFRQQYARININAFVDITRTVSWRTTLQSAIRHLKLADFSTVVRACAAIFCSSAYLTTRGILGSTALFIFSRYTKSFEYLRKIKVKSVQICETHWQNVNWK